MSKIIVLFIILLHLQVFSAGLNVTQHSEKDNVGYMRSHTTLSLTDMTSSIGKFGLNTGYNYGELVSDVYYINSFSTQIMDVGVNWGKQFNDLYAYIALSINDFSNLPQSIGYNGTLGYTFSDDYTSVIKLGYEKDYYKKNPTTMYYKLNSQNFSGEYELKTERDELSIVANYSFIDGIDSSTIIPAIDNSQSNEMFDSYALYMRKLGDSGLFSLGGILSYSNTKENFLIQVDSSFTAYPYYTPLNKITAELFLMKIFSIKDKAWITLKTQLPFYSVEDYVISGYASSGSSGNNETSSYTEINNEEVTKLYGTQDFKIGVSVVFPIANKFKVDMSYEYTQKPYASYAYLDFDNSYINNIFNINFLWSF